jgi:hypothetical protein
MSCEKRSMPNQLCLNEVEEHDDEMVVSRVSGRAGVLPPQPAPRELSPAPLFPAFGFFGSAKLPGEHVCIIMSITRVCREYRVLEVFPFPKLRRRLLAVNEHSVPKFLPSNFSSK